MQISVDTPGAHRDKALRDDPNESFAVFYYYLLLTSNKVLFEGKLFVEQTSRQINFCPKILTICFFFVEETFDHMLGDEIDHVSPMFISERESTQIWDAK